MESIRERPQRVPHSGRLKSKSQLKKGMAGSGKRVVALSMAPPVDSFQEFPGARGCHRVKVDDAGTHGAHSYHMFPMETLPRLTAPMLCPGPVCDARKKPFAVAKLWPADVVRTPDRRPPGAATAFRADGSLFGPRLKALYAALADCPRFDDAAASWGQCIPGASVGTLWTTGDCGGGC
eukprot:CAMPEP_0174851952 /NCGR_PEP_ID=MMETSP1114-20130205/24631_1 /TAXON_ID=312471 /ORGANISM="Neobodo designis, Strain CCAP 1951/1" /LENGTH=178 /DNA_ID=CAMNT_0016086519 /DNA_START=62 /DNA_END=598 /DNA_ORIENTATION=-